LGQLSANAQHVINVPHHIKTVHGGMQLTVGGPPIVGRRRIIERDGAWLIPAELARCWIRKRRGIPDLQKSRCRCEAQRQVIPRRIVRVSPITR
jgi:hypothetical protein